MLIGARSKRWSDMIIKLLGSPGCSSCQKLETLVNKAADDLGVEVEIIKVTDVAAIMGLGIISAPGLVVDEKVVVGGRLPSYAEVKRALQTASTG
jgi:small redox-active disulfide protein 2